MSYKNSDSSLARLVSNTEVSQQDEGAFEMIHHRDLDESVAEELLSSGWEARMNAEGRTYYIDHNLGITTWNRPNAHNANSTQHPQVNDRHTLNEMKMNDDLGPLPHGWQMKRNDNGRVFFVDHDNKKTTWIDPRTGRRTAQSTSHPELIQNGPLPDNWEVRTSPNGRHYYCDHINKMATWQNPRVTSADQKKYSNPGSPSNAGEADSGKISFSGSAPEI